MLFKRYKLVIIVAVITFILGGICFIKIKPYSEIVYPASRINVVKNLYFVNTADGFLYKTDLDTRVNCKLSKDKIDSIGIIIFKNKLYYINKISKKLCYIELNGENIKEVDTCNIIMPFQPLFRLGVHIYYYNHENELIRIDDNGIRENITNVNVGFSGKAILRANNKKIENESKIYYNVF